MKLPLSWLREYVDIGDISVQELSDKLLSIGFEVEDIITPRSDISGVVTGRVESIIRHENSDKLWVCRINIGSEIVQIVTGAQNVRQGDIVPVATVGAELPGGKKLVAAKLRGVDSFGMLCSGSELTVDDDVIDGASVDGILILPKDTPIGENIMKTLGLDDTVLDVSITANRPDCQAIVNLAREIAVLLGKKFKLPKLDYKSIEGGNLPPVNIECKNLCSRYIGRSIKDVKIEKSPKWMRDRLRMCDVRPINNLVDITNYVLLEFGQPLHAFDKRFIKDGIIVRKGKSGERITALDGKEYDVDNVLVIADTEKPLAIAGIMGGEYTSIFPDTEEVFLEAARFERSNIRRTSRKIGLRSDSSARYEKGVDWQSAELGSARALALIDMLGCGVIYKNATGDSAEAPEEKVIVTSKSEICDLLGIDIEKRIIVKLLKQQGIDVKSEGKKLICKVPLIREDIDGYPDLAEDVMRFYGYDNIVSTHSENTHQTSGGYNVHDLCTEALKERLCALGVDQTLSYSFISPDEKGKLLDVDGHFADEIVIKNPLSRDISVMRTQLVSSMLSSISRNCARKNDEMRFYELGKVFISDKLPLEKLPEERDVLCIGMCNCGDFYDIKALVTNVLSLFGTEPEYSVCTAPYLHPKQSLHIDMNGIVGDLGKVHPLVCENYDLPRSVYIAHIDVTEILNRPIRATRFVPVSKYQPVDRDLAVIVKDYVPVGDMLRSIRSVSEFIDEVKLFDIYTGEQIPAGYKSVAFSLRLQPTERSFSDSEIKSIIDTVLKDAETRFGAKLR